MNECSITRCHNPVKTRGWCQKHYMRWYYHGTTELTRPVYGETCSVDGCENKPVRRGMCGAHYRRNLRYGDPLLGATPKGIWVGKMCMFDGCDSPVETNDLCAMHAARVRRNGTTEKLRVRPPCSVDGCDKPNRSHGFCCKHLKRWQKYGDPVGGRRFYGERTEEVVREIRRLAGAKFRASESGKISRRNLNHMRRAAINGGTATALEVQRLFDEAVICPDCGDPYIDGDNRWRKSLDHIIPICKGGRHDLENLRIIHKSCNARKGGSMRHEKT